VGRVPTEICGAEVQSAKAVVGADDVERLGGRGATSGRWIVEGNCDRSDGRDAA